MFKTSFEHKDDYEVKVMDIQINQRKFHGKTKLRWEDFGRSEMTVMKLTQRIPPIKSDGKIRPQTDSKL